MARLMLLLIAAALVAAEPAVGVERSVELSRVASVFAMRPVDVRCPSPQEWAADPYGAGAWSYADLRRDFAVLSPDLCAGALGVDDGTVPAWQRAAGVLGLLHEAYHLRRWSHRRDEGKVMCQAIRHFRVGAQLLGASPALANELLPYALALHWRTVRLFPLYRDESCLVPVWSPPAVGP